MKAELQERGNQYDILDFLYGQTRQLIGLDTPSPTVSVLSKDQKGNKSIEEENQNETDPGEVHLVNCFTFYVLYQLNFSENEEVDPNVEELPEKVDLFVNYINNVYFNGNLDMESKQMFKQQHIRGQEG